MNTINKNELMIGDIFEVEELKNGNIKVEIFKIGNKQVDILVDGKERVCLMDSLLPIKLNDSMLVNDYGFGIRDLKISGKSINDLLKNIGDYFISLTKVNDKYNLSVTTINGEKVCESNNIEYLHNLQNIIRSNIKIEINYV